MEVSSVFALKSTRRFKEAAKSNMAEWFREFLRNNPPKKMNGTNHLAPLKQFMKFMKRALRKLRPEHASGVESGTWKLPCGLSSAKAWAFFEKQFAQLRVHLMPAVKDAAPKQSPCKGRFQIVPAEPAPQVDFLHRRRRAPKATTWERIGGQLVPVLDRASFLRRPSEDGPVKKGAVSRNEKRGQTKPQARR